MHREEYLKRIEKCALTASDRGFDGLLVISKSPERAGDIQYLTGHKPGLPGHVSSYNFRGRGFAGLLIPVDGPPTLFVTTPFYERELPIEDIRVGTDLPKLIGETFREKGFHQGVLGLVGVDVLPVSLYLDLKRRLPGVLFVSSDDIVMNQRAIKSDSEIEIMLEGAHIVDEVMELTRDFLDIGLTERAVQEFIIEQLRRRGVTDAFATCQSGVENSGEPMIAGGATEKRIEEGDMIHMEFNGKYKDYMIDVCRSTVVGRVSSKQRTVLELTLEMLETTIAAIRPNIAAEELARVAGRLAMERGFGRSHTLAYGGPATYLGHGIGLGIDEPPILAEGIKTRLKAGMVISVEPGIYRTEVGGARIEDEILVTADGAKSLNTAARKWW